MLFLVLNGCPVSSLGALAGQGTSAGVPLSASHESSNVDASLFLGGERTCDVEGKRVVVSVSMRRGR